MQYKNLRSQDDSTRNEYNNTIRVFFYVRQTMSLNWSSAVSDCANETQKKYTNALQLHYGSSVSLERAFDSNGHVNLNESELERLE